MRRFLTALLAFTAVPALAGPVPQGPPNAEWQTPAFAGQTRIDEQISGVQFNVETIASGLQNPWAIDFLPSGRAIVTEKAGRIRVITTDRRVLPAVAGAPAVNFAGQGGLLDLHVIRGSTTKLCLTYSEPRSGGQSGTAARCSKVTNSGENIKLTEHTLVWRQYPSHGGNGHYGSRIVLAPDGNLFITAGERQDTPIRDTAQVINNGIGKVVRRTQTGANPTSNPYYASRTGATKSAVWSYGHRNPQGAAIEPATGKLWTVEHGPQGGDELNTPVRGGNHGWPVVTYGEDYGGARMGEGITQRDDVVQPRYYWDPVIAPGGIIFYDGTMFPALRGNLLIAGLGAQGLTRLSISGDTVTGEEKFPLGHRIRDVAVAPDGAIWVVTDSSNGLVLRLTPAS